MIRAGTGVNEGVEQIKAYLLKTVDFRLVRLGS